MRILITGGSGFIGCHVVKKLAVDRAVETSLLVRQTSDLSRLQSCGIDLRNNGVRQVRTPRSQTPGWERSVRVEYADLSHPEDVTTVLGRVRPEVLIHLAMVYNPLGSPADAAVEAVNFAATSRLLEEFFNGGGRRFVAAGSCFEYGDQDGELIEETAPCRPIFDYAVAKAKATEAILARGQATDAETLVLRVFSPYGPQENRNRVVPQLITAGLSSQRVPLTAGEQVRDFVFVEDVAAAFVQAACRAQLPQRQAIYNVATGTGLSLRQLANRVQRVLGRPLDLDWGRLPYRPQEMKRLVGSNRRIAAELGWTPTYSLDEGLHQTSSWWQSLLGTTPLVAVEATVRELEFPGHTQLECQT